MSYPIEPRGNPTEWTPNAPIIVYVGPTLPSTYVHDLIPPADVRPPIRRGDMGRIDPPAIVAIIDGVFDAELAVAPSEIRSAIARGVRVMGSSSMGAVRAAEVHEMLGVGRVYEMYRSGSLQRDDEVAVLVDVDSGKALTEPLVNIRFAVDALVRSGSLDARRGASIVEVASAVHFHERTYANILRKAGLADLQDVDQLICALRAIDLKREDAHSLLERLPALSLDPHWSRKHAIQPRQDDYHDHFEGARVATVGRADANLLVWEFGEKVKWTALVDFLALTGKVDLHARRVLARAQGNDFEQPALPGNAAPVQELFNGITTEWGWNSTDEVHVTLNDFGIGFDDLQTQLRNERYTQRKMRGLMIGRDDAFMRALKVDLLMTDLSLKREVMRLGALQVLSEHAADTASLTETELQDAKRALLCERPEWTWEGILEDAGMSEADAQPTVRLIAEARRTGVGLLNTIELGHVKEGHVPASIASLPRGTRAKGALSHSIPDAESVFVAQKLGRVVGVTRVARVGELERFGLHVVSAYRASEWSSTVGSGKSESLDGAVVGALMEELEKYCQERFEPDVVVDAPFHQLGAERAVDPTECALPYDSSHSAGSPYAWSWMFDLVTGGRALVPAALLSLRRQRNDVLYSPRKGARVFSTSGLAADFTITEALVHALCERIERHAVKLAEQVVSNPGHLSEGSTWPFAFVDLETCPSSTQRILDAIRGADYRARVMDITCEVGVPTFSARICRTRAVHGLEEKYCAGSCTHPNPELAINRALLEAVQTRIASLSGAREDFSIQARSLGRHERPYPLSRGDAYWIRPYVPKKPLSSVSGLIARSAREDLEFIVCRLTSAGFDRVLYRDISHPETAPACVVRAFVPGMEDTNPFHTGLRARTLMVRELMRRHEW